MGHERKLSRDLKGLKEAVAKWRAEGGGGRGSRIPEELWKKAERVAAVDGVWLTAATVRLNYERLKGRVRGTSSTRRRGARRQPNGFVELSAAPLLCATEPGTVIEVQDKAGTRMIVRLAKEAPVDVAKWVHAFRRRNA